MKLQHCPLFTILALLLNIFSLHSCNDTVAFFFSSSDYDSNTTDFDSSWNNQDRFVGLELFFYVFDGLINIHEVFTLESF